MLKPQFLLPLADDLVVDLFAGGGGASTGIEAAIGRHVDIAVNHDAAAVSLHQANHPLTGTTECVDGEGQPAPDLPGISWVICGGESGPKARPMHPDWDRSLRDQCEADGAPFLFKQWREWREADDSGLPGVRTIHEGDPDWDDQAARCDAFMARDGELITDLDEARDGMGYRGLERIGKKAAGRQLDGRTHDEFPKP